MAQVMPEVTNKTPQGVAAILIGPDDRVIANAVDFSTERPGGFSKQEAQTLRAKDALAFKAIQELSSPLLSNSIGNYDAKQIIDKMCKNGCNILFVPIGYDEDGN